MDIKILPVPTDIKGLKIVNERFPSAWETVQRYNQAIKGGFCVEAFVLSINLLKYYITLLIEMYLTQREAGEMRFKNILKDTKDVGELISYLLQVKIISQSEYKIINDHWKKRNDTLHKFIDGKIKYSDVCAEANKHFQVCTLIFSKAFEIKLGPEEKVGTKIRRKITLSPKTVLFIK